MYTLFSVTQIFFSRKCCSVLKYFVIPDAFAKQTIASVLSELLFISLTGPPAFLRLLLKNSLMASSAVLVLIPWTMIVSRTDSALMTDADPALKAMVTPGVIGNCLHSSCILSRSEKKSKTYFNVNNTLQIIASKGWI